MLLGSVLWPLGFVAIAVTDDLINRKFHNFLFIGLSIVGFSLVAFSGLENLVPALIGFFVGGLILLPLVLLGALGAGDMKFMMCLGVIMGAKTIIEIFIFSIFWGALLGLLTIIISKRSSVFKNNLKEMIHFL